MSAGSTAENKMISRIKPGPIALLFAAALGLSSCAREEGRVWQALLPALPPRVSTELAGINVEQYILTQTHEPLFRTDDGMNFHSNILGDWSRSIDSKTYRFCPRPSLTFDAAHDFSTAFLRAHIERVTRQFAPARSVTQEADCVSVKFAREQPGYVRFLSSFENAPSIKQDDPRIEAGLGAYRVARFSAEKIVLARKTPIRDGYNEIILRLYAGPNDPERGNRRITDFNLIPPSDLPEWVKTDYQDIGGSLPKSYNLIINHPEPRIRKTVYDCLDMDGLRRAYFPARSSFLNLKTLLPVGVPGAQPGKPAQTCGANAAAGRGLTTPLVFFNWGENNEAALLRLMRDFSDRTGIPVEIKPITLSGLAALILKRPHPYNLAVVSMTVRRDDQSFMNFVVTPTGLLDVELPEASRLYARLLAERDPVRRGPLTAEIMAEITRQAVVLPLFQEERRFYYPAEIKNIYAGEGFQDEYPIIGNLRL